MKRECNYCILQTHSLSDRESLQEAYQFLTQPRASLPKLMRRQLSSGCFKLTSPRIFPAIEGEAWTCSVHRSTVFLEIQTSVSPPFWAPSACRNVGLVFTFNEKLR